MKSLQLHYSATDVKWRKRNLEPNLRLLLYFIAERKEPSKLKTQTKIPHLLQTPMLLADRAAQPSLDSHFLLTCKEHQYLLFRWKENIFYLKASKRHKTKAQTDPCTAQILATNKSDSLSSPFQGNGCCVWCPILQVHHAGFLDQLNCFREPLHLLQGNRHRNTAVSKGVHMQGHKSKQIAVTYLLRF